MVRYNIASAGWLKPTLAALTAGALLMQAGCSSVTSAFNGTSPMVTVQTYTASPKVMQTETWYSGKTAAAESVSVSAGVSGKVTALNFDVGDKVKTGDTLMQLDDTDINGQINLIQAQIDQANVAVKSAQNGLNDVTGGQYQAQILQQQASIDSYNKQLDSAAIASKNAQIALDNAKLAESSAQINKDNADVALKTAQSAYDDAQKAFNNTQILFNGGVVAQNDLDSAQSGLDQASAALAQAKNAVSQTSNALNQAQNATSQAQNAMSSAQVSTSQLTDARNKAQQGLNLTEGAITDDSTKQAQLAVEQAQAAEKILEVQLTNAKQSLSDTTVTSPIDGVVSARNTDKGQYASPTVPSFVIVNLDKMDINVEVSDQYVNSLKAGQSVQVEIPALSDDPMDGTITMVSPSANVATGTYPVKIEVDNSNGAIMEGMYAEARFIWQHDSKDAVVLPSDAVLTGGDTPYVFVIKDGVAVKTPVTVGVNDGTDVEILSGVASGDAVAIDGQTQLKDNEQVNAVVLKSTGGSESTSTSTTTTAK
jgi:RND family efflux transporter MFP subunit